MRKQQRGRPRRTGEDVTVAVRMEPEQAQRLDDIRRAERDCPNRSEMMRRLIERYEVANVHQ